MARHLLRAGYDLRVTTRTKDRAAPLLEAGARWAETPREAAEGADVAISIVGYPHDVEAVHLGPLGTLGSRRPPRIVVDMSTSRPNLARQIHQAAAAVGSAALDAPVSGGDVGAREATLSIMVGGDGAAFAEALPLFQAMGKTIVLQGGPGAGQHTKMVNQILIAGTMLGVCEGLLYANKAGLDPATVLSSVGGGAAGSWSVNNLVPRILRGDFRPGFFVEHFVKDLSIALEEAERMGLDLPGLALAKRLYEHVVERGYGRLGTHALYRTIAEASGVPIPALVPAGA